MLSSFSPFYWRLGGVWAVFLAAILVRQNLPKGSPPLRLCLRQADLSTVPALPPPLSFNLLIRYLDLSQEEVSRLRLQGDIMCCKMESGRDLCIV